MGHSIANGVGAADTTYAGAAVPAGIVARDNGSTISTWPSSSGTGPDPGVLPYLAASLGSGTLIRRAANGAILSQIETQFLPGAIADCIALGINRATVGLVILMIGENDAQDSTESAAFAARIEQTCTLVELAFPLARIVVQEIVTEAGGYSEHATIRSAQAAAVAARSTRELSPRTGITTQDTVHYTLAGYAVAAAAQWSAWLAAD